MPALNQAGTFLFAANGDGRNLSTFSVNTGTGALSSPSSQPANTLGSSGVLTGLGYWQPALLSNYPNATVVAGDNVTVTPDAPPGCSQSTASAPAGFGGVFTVNSATGAVTVTDARPAGSYTVTVTPNCIGQPTSTFTLTVTNPNACAAGFGFAPGSTVGAGTNPASVAVGDFNGDGKQDLAVANNSSPNVTILLGDGSGGFPTSSTVSAGNNPTSVAVGDFNGDGNQRTSPWRMPAPPTK